MGFFGMGMQRGILGGLEAGERVKQNRIMNERRDDQEKRAQEIHEYNLSAQKRQQAMQEIQPILEAAAMGKMTEDMVEKWRDISKVVPILDPETLLSPKAEAALGVAKTMSGPEDFNDPAKRAAVNYALTLGADADKFKSVRFSEENPDLLVATDKYGQEKPIPVEGYQNHILSLEKIRELIAQPQVQQQLQKYKSRLTGEKAKPGNITTVYDEKTGRERKAIVDPSTGEVKYVGGIKALAKGRMAKAPKQASEMDYLKQAISSLKDTEAYKSAPPEAQDAMIQSRIAVLSGKKAPSGGSASAQPQLLQQAVRAIFDKGADPKAVLERLQGIDEEAANALKAKLKDAGMLQNKYEKRYSRTAKKSSSERLADVNKKDTIEAVKKLVEPAIRSGEAIPPGLARAQINRLKQLKDDPEAAELIDFLQNFLEK